jgi:tetratricopeptide (TPR) repeat protein
MKTSYIIFTFILLIALLANCDNTALQGSYYEGIKYASHGDFNEAKKQFEGALRSGLSQKMEISVRESLKVIESVEKGKVKREAAQHFFKGIRHSNKGEVDATFLELDKAIELDPGFANAYYERGLANAHRGRFEEAITDFSKVIELNPNDAPAYNNRGLAYAKGKKQYYKALSDFSRAIALDPEFADAYVNRGITYRIAYNDKDMACADWKRACKLNKCNSYELARQSGYCK